jgi:uncharacterized membrane protein YhdT
MLRLSLRIIGWLFSILVIGAYLFTVEAALFVPPEWFAFTNILIPIRAAIFAWTALSVLLLAESLAKRPIQPHELLTRGASLAVSVVPTYTLAFSTLGGGLFWSLADKLDLTQRLLIGLVFLIGWLYVVVSPLLERDKWVKVGEVAIDSGQMLLTDPTRILAELPPLDELGGVKESDMVVPTLRIEGFNKPKGWTDAMASLACQVLFEEGHPGAGVTVKTGAGDGQYSVYGKFTNIRGLWGVYKRLGRDRLSGIKVEFTPWRPNAEPPTPPTN